MSNVEVNFRPLILEPADQALFSDDIRLNWRKAHAHLLIRLINGEVEVNIDSSGNEMVVAVQLLPACIDPFGKTFNVPREMVERACPYGAVVFSGIPREVLDVKFPEQPFPGKISFQPYNFPFVRAKK